MSEMNERSISLPVIDEKTHFIIGYEDVTKEEAKVLAAYMMASEETQREIRALMGSI